jgi:hypothetical protein
VLFARIYGGDGLSGDYYWDLMEKSFLQKQTKQFEKETEIWNEVSALLGEQELHRVFQGLYFAE